MICAHFAYLDCLLYARAMLYARVLCGPTFKEVAAHLRTFYKADSSIAHLFRYKFARLKYLGKGYICAHSKIVYTYIVLLIPEFYSTLNIMFL